MPKKKKPKSKNAKAAQRAAYRRRKAAEHSRDDSASLREIGPIPKCKNRARRKRAEKSLATWAKTYFPETFALSFSDDHISAIEILQKTVEKGGRFAFGMPRGSGKTSLCEVAAMFGIFTGKRRFVAFIGSTASAALESLETILGELETNELLLADYPEICYPIERLEGSAGKRKGQTVDGKRTQIQLSKDRIAFPTVDGSTASGSVIMARGLTGRIRGMKFKPPGKPPIRPDLCIIDDCQTDQSAYSDSQCRKREKTIKGAILGLAGPGKKIAAVLPCTIIRRGDVADRLLDIDISPEWQGQCTKLLHTMPIDLAAWDVYNEKRIESLRMHGDIRLASQHYKRNRKKLDKGCKAAWAERFAADEGELSAIQHGMNLYFEDLHAFLCEYQNEPPDENNGLENQLDAKGFLKRIAAFKRRKLPPGTEHLALHVDIQGQLLYFAVMAFGPAFRFGHIVEYGTFPKQPTKYFTLKTATKKLSKKYPKAKLSARIKQALEDCVDNDLMTRDYEFADSRQTMRITRGIIDANWGDSTDIVYAFCKASPHSRILTPGHGKYIGPASAPISKWKQKKGEKVGANWITRRNNNREVKHVTYDSNWFKTEMQNAFSVEPGDPGCITIHSGSAADHQMLIDQLLSEKGTAIKSDNRDMTIWTLPSSKPDNHLLDNVSGCIVATSLDGCKFEFEKAKSKKSVKGKGRSRFKTRV